MRYNKTVGKGAIQRSALRQQLAPIAFEHVDVLVSGEQVTCRRGALRVDPCIPRRWKGFEATLRLSGTEYQVAVENPHGVNRGVTLVELDGVARDDGRIPLGGGGIHAVRVVMG